MPSVIATFVTADPGPRRRARARARSRRSQAKCRERNVLFDYRPKVHAQLIENYYTPGAKLEGRCLYPFLHARVSFSGKVYFCPFIRVEVGDLTHPVARRGLERRDATSTMRQTLVENGIFPGVPALLQGGAVAGAGRRAVRRRSTAAAPRHPADGGA